MATSFLFQLIAEGRRPYFGGAPGHIYSKRIFRKQPTQKQIETFIDFCCDATDKTFALSSLDRATIQVRISELILDDDD